MADDVTERGLGVVVEEVAAYEAEVSATILVRIVDGRLPAQPCTATAAEARTSPESRFQDAAELWTAKIAERRVDSTADTYRRWLDDLVLP